jgi:hypothetical protein
LYKCAGMIAGLQGYRDIVAIGTKAVFTSEVES